MKRCSASFFFCLILCASALAQDRGTIQCDPGSTRPVPAWTAPGRPYIVEQLSCGQTVTVVGLEQGYVKIRIGGQFAFVNAKYVRLQGAPMATGSAKAGQSSHREYPLQRGLDFGMEASNFEYREPGLMKETGMMWGIVSDYAFRPNNLMFKLDGRFSLGDLDYSSPISGTLNGIRDYNVDTRFMFGRDYKVSDKACFTPFVGLGYRYLFDGSGGKTTNLGSEGYDRESHYIYSPAGLESLFRLKAGWSLGVSGEYDILWHGWQYSKLGGVEPGLNTLANDQNKGWGTRGSVKIIKYLGKVDLSIEPFIRYWKIQQSNLAVITYYGAPTEEIGLEPNNKTIEWGSRLGIRY